MSRPPLPPIDFRALCEALLSRAYDLVPDWLPGGHQRGHEWVCGSLSGGSGESCSVNLSNGKWADFSGDEKGGDLLSLYAAIHEISQGEAAKRLAREEGLEQVAGIVSTGGAAPPLPPRPPAPPKPPPPPRDPEGWSTLIPVPAFAPEPTFRHHAPERSLDKIVHKAEYRVGEHLLGFVVRFLTSDGGKETLPYTWCVSAKSGSAKWHWRQWDEPRPLYYPNHAHPEGLTVILVEGEKKAETLQALLDAAAPGVYCVASWAGGCKAWQKASWEWLKGSTVLLWPDCDAKREPLKKAEREAHKGNDAALERAKAAKPLLPLEKQPGWAAMLGIGARLRDNFECDVSMLQIPAPGEVADGWDCGDAITTDGWDGERVLQFFAGAVRLVAPAPEPEPEAKPAAPAPAEAPAAEAEREPEAGGRPWWLKPYWDSEKNRWLTSRKLVIAALTNDEALQGILGINLLSNNIDARRPWPWAHSKAGPITSAIDLQLGQYLSRTYGLPSINRAALGEAIETIAHENPFHPVREYLQGLQHDGTPRIDKWLVYALGETPQTLPAPVFEYLCLVGRYWLLGMVNRVMDPGCKFDYCPVLEGPGGLGKSTLVETLASAAYFSDTHFDVGRGKEGQEQVQGLWLYEIAELANFGKAEIALIKAFISAKVDRYRPSYGRVVEAYARQCVLAGTTNESTYLRDRTGNRRFWPTPVRQAINIAWVARHRDQLFAEAYALFQAGVAYTPSRDEEARLFVPMQESRLVETAVLSELLHVLTRTPVSQGIGSIVNELTEFVTMSQLTTALGVDAAKSNPGLEAQIRSWMEHEGWARDRKMVNGVRAWGYVRPKVWPPVDPEEEPKNETPVPAGVEDGGADDAPF